MKPTRLRGLRLAYGSWKTIISSRRIGRISARLRCEMSRPSKMISPAVGSRRRMMQRAIVDLPQPDSPTTPSVSRGFTSNEMSSTAFTVATSFWKMIPRVTGKYFLRFLTSSSASLMRAPRRRQLPAGNAGLRRRLTSLAAPGSPGPYSNTVPSGRAPRATPEERAWAAELTVNVSCVAPQLGGHLEDKTELSSMLLHHQVGSLDR